MKYQIQITVPAQQDMEEYYQWIAKDSPQQAVKWFHKIKKHILTLDEQPKRCPIAPENQHFKQEIRQFLFGKASGQFRILYTIKNATVIVLHVRHSSKNCFSSE